MVQRWEKYMWEFTSTHPSITLQTELHRIQAGKTGAFAKLAKQILQAILMLEGKKKKKPLVCNRFMAGSQSSFVTFARCCCQAWSRLWRQSSPWFQSRGSLRPLPQDGNARKPLRILHFSLLERNDSKIRRAASFFLLIIKKKGGFGMKLDSRLVAGKVAVKRLLLSKNEIMHSEENTVEVH